MAEDYEESEASEGFEPISNLSVDDLINEATALWSDKARDPIADGRLWHIVATLHFTHGWKYTQITSRTGGSPGYFGGKLKEWMKKGGKPGKAKAGGEAPPSKSIDDSVQDAAQSALKQRAVKTLSKGHVDRYDRTLEIGNAWFEAKPNLCYGVKRVRDLVDHYLECERRASEEIPVLKDGMEELRYRFDQAMEVIAAQKQALEEQQGIILDQQSDIGRLQSALEYRIRENRANKNLIRSALKDLEREENLA